MGEFVMPYEPVNYSLPHNFWFPSDEPFDEPDDEASNPRIMEPAR